MANPFDQFDAPSANPFDQFDAPAAPEQPKPSSLARRALGDTAVSLAKGVVGTGEAAVGLADLATGGYAGKALSDATGFNPKATKAALDSLYSPEQQKANQAVQGAEGFGNTLGAIARNPSVALQAIAESAPAMLGGGAVAQGIGKIGLAGNALARGALGEGIVGAGQQAEQFRQDNPEGALNGRQTLASLASGAGTAAFSGLGGKVAQKLGIGDIDTVLAGGAGKIAPQSLARRMGEGVVSEGMLEEMPQSVWEHGAQNFGNDKPLTEGMGNAAAMGLVTGGMMGAGFNALQSPTKQPQGKPMQPPADLATKPPANPLATPGENIAMQQQILDEQEQLAASINPADGPLSSAASLAVQTGAAKTPTQLAIEQEQQRAAELAAQQDDAESEIYNSTGIEDQADNLDWMRLLSGEQADLADLRDKAQFEAKQRQSRQAGELRDAKDQMLAEGAYEAGQRRAQQQAQQAANPGLPFERIAPEDYDTINPVKLGEGEIVRDDPRQLPPPRQQNALPPGNRAAPALGFTPKAPDPMQATDDGLVGTARQFDELRAMKRERKDQMRRASELAQSLVRQGATLQGKSLVAPSGRVLAPQLTLPQYRAVSDALKQNQTNAQQNLPQAAPAQAQQAETQGQEQPAAPQPVAPSPENQDGTVRPAAGSVSGGSDSQGGVDARSVVDNRADRGSGYERAGEGDATAKPASRVPSAGADGERAKPAKLLKRGRSPDDVSAAINEIASLAGRAPEQTREAYDRWVSDSGRDRADEILFANLEKYRKQKGEGAPAATNQSPIKNETRADAGPKVETAPADQEAIKGRAESLREPRPLDFTPKQYHEARIKWVAQEYGLSDAEARLDYDTPAARKDDEQAWADAVRQAFKDGTELTRATLDKLEEIRPGAFMSNLHDYPEAKIPNGYQLPAARKAENDFADAKREDRRKAAEKRAAESSPEPSPLASLFSDLDSTSTRKANKASRAAQSHPKAAEIDYVQKNFHDVLLRLMEEGKLTVNGVSSVSEENSQCL